MRRRIVPAPRLLRGIRPIGLSGAYIAAFRMNGVVNPQQAPTECSVSQTLDQRKSLGR